MPEQSEPVDIFDRPKLFIRYLAKQHVEPVTS